jgi:hypothetical protein
MIDSLKLWWKRQRLRQEMRGYSQYVDKAKGEERDFRIAEAINFRNAKRDEILSTSSMLLADQAEGLGLPVPPLSDEKSWVEGWWPGTVRLTVEAQVSLRKDIRRERRERWNFAAFFLGKIMTPLIGGIGAIMGLLSLIHSFKAK